MHMSYFYRFKNILIWILLGFFLIVKDIFAKSDFSDNNRFSESCGFSDDIITINFIIVLILIIIKLSISIFFHFDKKYIKILNYILYILILYNLFFIIVIPLWIAGII